MAAYIEYTSEQALINSPVFETRYVQCMPVV